VRGEGHGRTKWAQTSFTHAFAILVYLKGYELKNSKLCCYIILMPHCHGNNPRWPPNNYLKAQISKAIPCRFLKKITVSTNIKLSSFLRSILWLLCFSFTLLYYLHFMLVKMIPMIFQIGIKLKQISPATSLLVEVTTSQYTNTP